MIHKINEASQKTHTLALDLFLIMIVAYGLYATTYTTTYEIIPEEQGHTYITYQPTTNNPVLTKEDYKALIQPQKDFHKKITWFGTSIFILYAITQRKRWKQKFFSITKKFED